MWVDLVDLDLAHGRGGRTAARGAAGHVLPPPLAPAPPAPTAAISSQQQQQAAAGNQLHQPEQRMPAPTRTTHPSMPPAPSWGWSPTLLAFHLHPHAPTPQPLQCSPCSWELGPLQPFWPPSNPLTHPHNTLLAPLQPFWPPSDPLTHTHTPTTPHLQASCGQLGVVPNPQVLGHRARHLPRQLPGAHIPTHPYHGGGLVRGEAQQPLPLCKPVWCVCVDVEEGGSQREQLVSNSMGHD